MCDTSNALVRSLVIWDHIWDHLCRVANLPPDRGDSHAFIPQYMSVLIYRPQEDERLR